MDIGMFEIGDRVRIRTDSRYYESNNNSNPINVIGTIIEICTRFSVRWDNTRINTYREHDLVLVEETILWD